ncbi:hypothetical protein PSPO01_09440 [Paraphaeosphaeria sporulosa]
MRAPAAMHAPETGCRRLSVRVLRENWRCQAFGLIKLYACACLCTRCISKQTARVANVSACLSRCSSHRTPRPLSINLPYAWVRRPRPCCTWPRPPESLGYANRSFARRRRPHCSTHGALMASSNRCDVIHRLHMVAGAPRATLQSFRPRLRQQGAACPPATDRGAFHLPGGSVPAEALALVISTASGPHLSHYASPDEASSAHRTGTTAPHLTALRGAAEAKRPAGPLTAPACLMKASARRRAVLSLLKQPKTANGR